MPVLDRLGSERNSSWMNINSKSTSIVMSGKIDQIQHGIGQEKLPWSISGISLCCRVLGSKHNRHGYFHESNWHPSMSLAQLHTLVPSDDPNHQLHQSLWVVSFVENINHHYIDQTYQIICVKYLFVNPSLWYPWSWSTGCFFVFHNNLLALEFKETCHAVQQLLPTSLKTLLCEKYSFYHVFITLKQGVEDGTNNPHVINRLTILKTCWKWIQDIGVIFMTRMSTYCIHIFSITQNACGGNATPKDNPDEYNESLCDG